MKNMHWSAAILHCQQAGKGYVIATIINTRGSTPRDAGSKMVIDAESVYDTLGGGQLEFLIVQQARQLLLQNKNCQRLQALPLAAEAAQCCGGNVTLMLECFAASDWQISLFGAGHVSQALVAILAGLPCQVRIIDSRPQFISAHAAANCTFELHPDPVQAVTSLAANSWVVIFTHDHALDFQLCCALLREKRYRYLGLIGSHTKALRFRQRLRDAGFEQSLIERIHSPIGLPEVKGKLPMEVAVSIAAQLQSLYYQGQSAPRGHSTSWREIKSIMQQPVLPSTEVETLDDLDGV